VVRSEEIWLLKELCLQAELVLEEETEVAPLVVETGWVRSVLLARVADPQSRPASAPGDGVQKLSVHSTTSYCYHTVGIDRPNATGHNGSQKQLSNRWMMVSGSDFDAL